MDYQKLKSRYTQFGGLRLVWQYAKLGALPVVFRGFVRCAVRRQSYKAIYPEILKIVEPFLIQKYGDIIHSDSHKDNYSHEHPRIIWFCWLQGIDNSPEIVKACLGSLQRNLKDYEIKVIDTETWNKFIQLPDYIQTRWNKKQIPPALFSDLLRLQLLITYGGTWIDSTVLCTGTEHTEEYLDADLFLFQYTRPGEKLSGSISNWFISAHSNNIALMVLRDMLFAYWRDFDCTLDYYIFHLFFAMMAAEYPELIAPMPYGYSMNSLVLLHHWGEAFNQIKWDNLTSHVSFHKLAFRVSKEIKVDKKNYYNYILTRYTHLT